MTAVKRPRECESQNAAQSTESGVKGMQGCMPRPAQAGHLSVDFSSNVKRRLMSESVEATLAIKSRSTDVDARVRGNGYRWGQLALGLVCMAMVANLQYGWTLFVTPMETKNHWGLAAIQLAFSIFIVVETWLVPVEGWLVDKFGPRPVVAGGAILAALAWVMNSFATTLPELYAAAVIAGLGAGGVYGTCVGNALKWFPDKRGLAAGITAAGFGAGSALTVAPIQAMIKDSGFQTTFLYFGLGQGIIIVLLAFFLFSPKAGQVPAVTQNANVIQTRRNYQPTEVIRQPIFWLMYF